MNRLTLTTPERSASSPAVSPWRMRRRAPIQPGTRQLTSQSQHRLHSRAETRLMPSLHASEEVRRRARDAAATASARACLLARSLAHWRRLLPRSRLTRAACCSWCSVNETTGLLDIATRLYIGACLAAVLHVVCRFDIEATGFLCTSVVVTIRCAVLSIERARSSLVARRSLPSRHDVVSLLRSPPATRGRCVSGAYFPEIDANHHKPSLSLQHRHIAISLCSSTSIHSMRASSCLKR